MLPIAQSSIPRELKQHVEKVSGTTKSFNLSLFTDEKDAEPRTKFLTYPSGYFLFEKIEFELRFTNNISSIIL